MSTPIITFRPGAAGLPVNLDQLVASRLLIQANSGGGKSRMLRYILEQTHGSIQQIVLDPEGEFATLREKFGYLLAGRDGDVPAEPKTAKLLARRLLELSASAVIDLYDLPLDQRRRFVRLFLEELMHLPRALWRPLLVVIDEAHVFIPERGAGEAESTEAAIALCTQGRKRGFAAVLATQRISKLHKDAAAEQLNKLIGRTGLDVDLKRAGDELGMDKESRLQLRDLEPGEFYAFGPAISRKVVKVRSGPIVTTHPQPGAIAPPAPPPPAAVQKVITQLHDLAKRAEEEAKTEAELRDQVGRMQRRIRELERVPTPSKASAPDPAALQRQIDAALARERKEADARDNQRYREQLTVERQIRKAVTALEFKVNKAAGIAEQLVAVLRNGNVPPLPERAQERAPVRAHPTPVPPDRPARPHPTKETRPPAAGGISSAQQKILNALATYESLGDTSSDRASVAAFAGLKQGGHFNNSVSSLRTSGLIEYPGDGVLALTDAGRAAAEAVELTSVDDVHALWYRGRSSLQQKVLDQVIEAWPEPISRADLAAAIGAAEGGHFNNTVSSLRTLGAIDYPTKGSVRASDRLFPEALR